MFGNKASKLTMLLPVLAIAGFTLSFQVNAACNLVSTKDGSPLPIKAMATDTPEAKQFLETCINPYTKIYMTDAKAAKIGKGEYYFCGFCHGPKLEGGITPSLAKNGSTGWVYAKNATDKGMFETIAGGAKDSKWGEMSPWHKDVVGHVGDGISTDQILKVIAYIRTEYKGDGENTWLK